MISVTLWMARLYYTKMREMRNERLEYHLSIGCFHARENRRSGKLREVDDEYLRCRGLM
jgi:hypothetical protein